MHQIEAEVKAFLISDQVFFAMKSILSQRDQMEAEEDVEAVNSISLTEFSDTLLRLRGFGKHALPTLSNS